MIVRRTTVLIVALLLPVAGPYGSPDVEADPHELYDKAKESLADGELRAAAASLARLKALIARRPDWDPEGVFAERLLPPLSDRLNRAQGAARRLDEFTVKALEDLEPPDLSDDISTVRDYTRWAVSVIERLRAERDQIVGAALTDPEERAFLTRTQSYIRTEQLLEVDVLKRMADVAGDDILGLLGGDPEIGAVLVRFRQLKREFMKTTTERDRLQKDLQASHERGAAVLGVLAAVVTDAGSLEAAAGSRPSSDIAARFPRFLDDRLTAARGRTTLTPEERQGFLADLDRYARCNRVLLEAGLVSDQAPRIEALAKAVDGLPVEGDIPDVFAVAGPACLLLIGSLTLATGITARLAIRRGRQLASFHRPAAGGVQAIADAITNADADRRAV